MIHRKPFSLFVVGYLLVLLFLGGACATTSETATTSPAGEASAAADTVAATPPARPAVPSTVPITRPNLSAQAGLDTVRAGRFDSGKMWTFEDPPLDYLRETYDFAPDPAWFERARLGALRLPGCTASFVSPHGLVMTNHHCARGAITQVSQPGEALIENGFYAGSLDQERRVDGYYADQLIDIRDVTDEVYGALEGAETDAERAQARTTQMEEITRRLTQEAGGEAAGIVVEVISLYHGGRYSAYVFRRYDDLRLVMAPELQLAYFGGDPDNFTYPRYALDVTFFRVYGADGAPLETSDYFAWSEEGASEGDLVFVIGNPGSTNRLETVAQLEFRRDVQEKALLDYINRRVAALQAHYDEEPSDEVRNQLFSLLNAQKLYRGRVQGLHDPVLMARRRDTERQFREAIEADATLRAEYGELVDHIADIQRQKQELAAEYGAFQALQPASVFSSATLRRALLAYRYLTQRREGTSAETLAPLREQILSVGDQPPGLDRRYLTARFEEFQQYFGEDSQLVREVLMGRAPAAQAAYVLEHSALADSAGTARALDEGLSTEDDPALQIAGYLMPRYGSYQSAFAGLAAQQQEAASRLGGARFDIYGISIPPDATFSLRIADGVVRGYPYNGTVAPPYTTFYGLYDHYHAYPPEREEWNLPARWLTPPEAFALETPLNLVSTNDIIGGNSGSPLLNRDLEVVGLIFDGNIESLVSSFIYVPDRARAVSVDARGILESLGAMYDADRIVLELTTGRLVETEAEADAVRSSQP